MGNQCGLTYNLDTAKAAAPHKLKALTQKSQCKEKTKIEQVVDSEKFNASTYSPSPSKTLTSSQTDHIKPKKLASSSILDFYKVDPKIIGNKLLILKSLD